MKHMTCEPSTFSSTEPRPEGQKIPWTPPTVTIISGGRRTESGIDSSNPEGVPAHYITSYDVTGVS